MIRSKLNIFLRMVPVMMLLMTGTVFAQNYGVKIGFVNPQTEQDIDKVASNVLKIINNSASAQDVMINISSPDENWKIIGAAKRAYHLAPFDSLFVPVRIIPDKNAKGNTSYLTSVYLTSKGIQLAFTTWNISISKVSSWFAKIPKKKIYFPNASDTSWFSVEVHNTGNSEEKLILNLYSSPYLMIFDSSGTHLIQQPHYFTLNVNETRYFYYMVIRRGRIVLPTDVDDESKLGEKDAVKVNIKNQSISGKNYKYWNGTIEFLKLFDELKVFENGYSSIPLSIELNSYNLLSRNSYLTFDLYGHAILPRHRSLTYFLQTSPGRTSRGRRSGFTERRKTGQ